MTSAWQVKSLNFVQAVEQKGVRFSNDQLGRLVAHEGRLVRTASDRSRGWRTYRRGIQARGINICRSYCLDAISFNKNDVVVDCGANYGDLFIRLDGLIARQNYFAFEPNPDDFQVLELNVGAGANLNNCALGDADGEQEFFCGTRSGDSSLIAPPEYTSRITVPVKRLDTFIEQNSLTSIKLLKIEAEGSEPEVLRGIGAALHRVEFIAVDGGYERGTRLEQTFTDCTNLLLQSGFEIVDIYPSVYPSIRALFRRKTLASEIALPDSSI